MNNEDNQTMNEDDNQTMDETNTEDETETETETVVDDFSPPVEAVPITAEALVQELRDRHFRNPLGTSTIGEDNPEDVGRLVVQVEDNVINPIILARYLNVRPQMIYQAIREGKLTAVDWNNTQKKFIRLPEAMRYAARYLTRKQLRDLQAAQDASDQTNESTLW